MFSVIKTWIKEAKEKAVIREEVADVRMTTKYGPAVVPPRPRPGRPTPYVIDPGMTTKYGPVVVPPRTKPGRPDMTTKYGPVVVPPRRRSENEVIEVIQVNPTTTLYACPVIGKKGGKGGR